MDISARKFTATQCLYTLVLNNPTLKLTDINGSLREDYAKDMVKAAFRLAEMMDEESDYLKMSKEMKGEAFPNVSSAPS